jgi:hypothetical protein
VCIICIFVNMHIMCMYVNMGGWGGVDGCIMCVYVNMHIIYVCIIYKCICIVVQLPWWQSLEGLIRLANLARGVGQKRNSGNSLPWTIWELPNLVPCGRSNNS